jgi:hypothetical protein
LLSWQALSLKGLKVAFKPNARPQVELREAELSDFYARLVVTEQARLNLQDVVARAPGAASAAASGVTPSAAPAPNASGTVGVAAAPVSARELPIDIQIAARVSTTAGSISLITSCGRTTARR